MLYLGTNAQAWTSNPDASRQERHAQVPARYRSSWGVEAEGGSAKGFRAEGEDGSRSHHLAEEGLEVTEGACRQ